MPSNNAIVTPSEFLARGWGSTKGAGNKTFKTEPTQCDSSVYSSCIRGIQTTTIIYKVYNNMQNFKFI